MRRGRGSSIGDVKGARHADSQNAIAGVRFIAQHGSGTLLSTRTCDLEAKRISLTTQPNF
jgi:hypothetical protein